MTAAQKLAWKQSFAIFNKMNAKFRVAVTNTCNMNCFFCHNEGMPNPRSAGDPVPLKKKGHEELSFDDLVQLMNDFCDLGGGQLNITGGEPLVRKDIVAMMNKINKQNTRVILNSNVMLAERLLQAPKVEQVDAIYASLHTTKESDFKKHLGIGGGAQRVMDNMVLLQKHGYRVQINYSLGAYNMEEFAGVVDFALKNRIDLKSITLIRSDTQKEQYGEEKHWTNPTWIKQLLESRGAKPIGERSGFGGHVTAYSTTGEENGHKIEIKNIGQARLETDYCNGCKYEKQCGEGIYALRSGVDALWKPCLLNKDKFEKMNKDEQGTYKTHIYQMVHKMVGNWDNHKFVSGSPM